MSPGLNQVGYGDVSPADNAGKITFIVFILLGLSIIGFAMGVLVAESAKLTDRERSVGSHTQHEMCDSLDMCSLGRSVSVASWKTHLDLLAQ